MLLLTTDAPAVNDYEKGSGADYRWWRAEYFYSCLNCRLYPFALPYQDVLTIPRLEAVFDEDVYAQLQALSEATGKSLSLLTSELVVKALEACRAATDGASVIDHLKQALNMLQNANSNQSQCDPLSHSVSYNLSFAPAVNPSQHCSLSNTNQQQMLQLDDCCAAEVLTELKHLSSSHMSCSKVPSS
ncbi:hypothetical protein SynBIOSU31_02270 [Synechococcus sp. BIOS-U3-1]|uniref:hypothetical protein n=1 Tax=Synechococcus sp. BIOS-U3-1 TaxID=1400865 RepID=UPI00164905CB|nr:hypothetical protein [Synechococcus sp. BIOS-U3-1]QNI59136.1 hypothetical protein SynBIOSU31_02270 [Synechococcus sp. BIOS-U3-1]